MSKDNVKSNAKDETKKAKKINNGAYKALVLDLNKKAKEATRKSLKKCAEYIVVMVEGAEESESANFDCIVEVCKAIPKDDLLYKFMAQKTRQGMNKAGSQTGWVPFYLLQAIYKEREALNGKFHFNIAFNAEVKAEVQEEEKEEIAEVAS